MAASKKAWLTALAKSIPLSVLALLLLILSAAVLRLRPFRKTLTVNRTYTVGRTGGLYVATTDGEVYRYGNDLIKGDFNAAEEWSALRPGEVVDASGYGFRIAFLGLYPVITSVAPASQ